MTQTSTRRGACSATGASAQNGRCVPNGPNGAEGLKRELSLVQAVALNMIDMVGIGPFVVLPLVIGIMGGPQHIVAWVAGALLALFDRTTLEEMETLRSQVEVLELNLQEGFEDRYVDHLMLP